MEAAKTAKNTNLTRFLTIGGIGVAVFAASYYLLKNSKNKQSTRSDILPKELVLKLLQEIRREMHPSLDSIVKASKRQSRRHGSNDPSQTNKDEKLQNSNE